MRSRDRKKTMFGMVYRLGLVLIAGVTCTKAVAVQQPELRGSENEILEASGWEERGAAALSFVNGLDLESIVRLSRKKTNGLSQRLIASWQKIAICSRARMIELDLKSTRVSKERCDEFISVINEICGVCPREWEEFLRRGVYTQNDWFDPFDGTESIEFQSDFKLTASSDKLQVTRDGILIQEFDNPLKKTNISLICAETFEGNQLFLVLDDLAEGWGYHCLMVHNNEMKWKTKLEPYWAFPEGGSHKIFVEIKRENAYVFAALPSSMSINGFGLSDGKRRLSFSTKLPD